MHLTYSARWDKFGIAGSGICLVHCLAFPIAALVLPGMNFLDTEALHLVLGICLAVLAGLAFVPGYRHHRRKHIVLLMSLGLSLILLPIFGGETFYHAETMLTVLGSIFLMVAHYRNHASCKTCACQLRNTGLGKD